MSSLFFTIEKNDDSNQISLIFDEVVKSASEIGTNNIMVSPFVHLSNNIAEPEKSKKLYEELMDRFKKTNFNVKSSHFGYHKSLLLDIKGYPGSFRYREF